MRFMVLFHNKKSLKFYRGKIRQNMSCPEIILWQKIRNKQLGVKFRRQFSIGNYILDFYSPEIKLGIEVDGETHFVGDKDKLADELRDKILARNGVRILRFLNADVMNNLNGCLMKIMEFITPTVSPPYKGGDGEGVKENL